MTSYLDKKIEISSMIIVVTAVFQENNKYYQQVFLDECLYKLYKQKSGITVSINHKFARISIDSYNSLPIEKY